MTSHDDKIIIIVANDQQAICDLWQRIINMQPDMYCPAYALDGNEVLRVVQQYQADIVLMDVLMPGMRGDEATRILQKESPDTLVIAYSAFGNTQQDAMQAGAVEFVLMPIPPNQMTALIREIHQHYHAQHR